MKRINIIQTLFFPLVIFFLFACGAVPITGRRSLNLVGDSEILASSQLQYTQFIAQSQLSRNGTVNQRVLTIAKRLAAATDSYLRQNGYNSLLKQMHWEFNVVESNQVNAFCMPGGKIVVYTGLLKLIGNGPHSDDMLAAVLGHEISHALAKHANERISNAMLTGIGGQLLGVAVSGKSQTLQQIIGLTYGIGSQVFIALPFSRKHEYEADKMGLVLMALAGYDPHYAVDLWRKMSASGGAKSSELLSTHPSDANRIAAIEKALPEAMNYYRARY